MARPTVKSIVKAQYNLRLIDKIEEIGQSEWVTTTMYQIVLSLVQTVLTRCLDFFITMV